MKTIEELQAELKELEEKKKEVESYVIKHNDIFKQIQALNRKINEYAYYQAQELEKDFKIEIATALIEDSLSKEEYKREDGSLREYQLDEILNNLKFLIADTRSYMSLFAYEEQYGDVSCTKENIFQIMHKYNIYYLFIRNRSYYDDYGQKHIWIDFEYEKIKD